jgi:hypothetical protein
MESRAGELRAGGGKTEQSRRGKRCDVGQRGCIVRAATRLKINIAQCEIGENCIV